MLRRLLLPATIIGLAVAADRGLLGAWSADAQAPARLLVAARIACAAALLLAWRLRSGRAARAAVILGLVIELLAGSLSRLGASELRAALAVLLPLDLAIFAWLHEASLLSRPGLLRLVTVPLGALLLTPSALARVAAWGFAPADDRRWMLASFVLASVAILARLGRRGTPLEAAWLGLLAAYAAVFVVDGGRVFVLAGGAVLTAALIERAFTLAFLDRLTALPGRAALDQRLGELGAVYAIAMVDVDHFKRVNDRHGHDTGDEVLRWIAGQLGEVGGGGVAHRYGGEEFAIVFAGRGAAETRAHAEALRRSIGARPFVLRAPRGKATRRPAARSARAAARRSLTITVSIGLAERSAKAPTPAAVLKAADRALYRAKRLGRDRVVVARA